MEGDPNHQPGYPPQGSGEGIPPYQHHGAPPGYPARPHVPGGGGALSALTAAAAAANAAPGGRGAQLRPPPVPGAGRSDAVPRGKVVESGQEHTGRWTKEEHEAFLSALQMYGKEWKKVAARVKTRTVVQTRTHAQKYFQKLQKVLETGGEKEANSVLGMVGGPGITLGGSPGMTHSNIAAMMDLGLGVPNSTEKKSKRRRSASAKKREQQQQQQQQYQPRGQSPAIPRSSSATAAALLDMSQDRRLSSSSIGPPGTSPTAGYPPAPPPSQQQHGFTTTMAEAAPASAHGFGYPPPASAAGLSIVAPSHDDAFLAGKFPEPSPAACGKRKLAEIAAAQMLAGVVGATAPAAAMPPSALRKRGSVSGTAELAAASVAVDPLASSYPEPLAAGEDARGTPPPPPPEGEPERRMSLQIVNPDTFAAQGNGVANRRLIHGQPSPSTPWDGQLEALVSQVKNQDMPPSSPPPEPGATNGATAPNEAAMPNQEEATASPDSINLPLPLRNPGNDLQAAICNKLELEVAELAATNPALLNERDENGFQPLHSAAALGLWDYGLENNGDPVAICNSLIDSGADVAGRDAQGNTPVHWAARSGHCEILGLLLQKGCPLDAQNDAGETALHWAMRAGERGTGGMGNGTVKVLVENGAQVNVFNRNFKRPLDVAAEGFEGLEEGPKEDGANANVPAAGPVVDQRARRAARWNLMRFSPQCRTLVLHHHECLDHLAKADHDWEVPDRIDHIMSILNGRIAESCDPGDEQSFRPYEMTVSSEFERATLELLSRIHSAEYLAFVNDLSKELERKRKQQLIEDTQDNLEEEVPERPSHVVPFTPMVQRKILKGAKTKDDGHSDTAFSAGSLKAARRAAGAVQHAVDCVLVGRNRNAFCIVRPPGHHAGINGLLSDAESCGFCLFNNVAAGAMHALSDEKHRPRCERCAIVDIDAHHGNGTEEIVRKCHDSGRLLFFSVHLYDHDKPKKGQTFQYKFYPGTGAEDDVAHNIINVPIAPLWREKEVVKSISLASNGGTTVEPRQTRQRSKVEAAKRVPSLPDLSKLQNDAAITAASLKPFGAVSDTASVASDSSQSSKRPPLPSASPHYPPHYLMGVGRLAYRRAIMHRLLPALRAFNPDLIILSTGLDAARGDVGNARHYVNGTEAMGFDLEPEDYAWTARKVCEVADICCDGRVVSVLEGGYGRTPPAVPAPPLFDGEAPETTEPVKQKLDKSFFSECALQHLQGLVDPYHPDEEQQKNAK